MDYVNHARSLGYEPVIACPERYKPGLPVFEIPRFSDISPGNGIKFTELERVSVAPHELAFLSWPTHYEILEPRLSRWTRHEQVIFIVQNVRWANPAFTGGYAVRLLSRPMARIMTNEVVLEAVKPYLNPTSMTEGDEVASLLDGSSHFEFRAIRNPVGWAELRELYHWSDVFLATPLVEEGFYMPGLEAMAAGAIVISSDAGGNRAYCRFGENCIGVGMNDARGYVDALEGLRAADVEEIGRLRRGGYQAVGRHTLESERERFGEFMERLTGHLRRLGPRME